MPQLSGLRTPLSIGQIPCSISLPREEHRPDVIDGDIKRWYVCAAVQSLCCDHGVAGVNFVADLLQAILDADPSSRSGSYRVQPSAASPTSLVVYCDMDTAGGGWSPVWQVRTFRGRHRPDDQLTHYLPDSHMLVPALLRYDRDAAALANHTSLVPGFGRSTLNAKAMEVLPFADGDGVSQASIDCRFFLESGDVGGNMLSIGVDSVNTSGYDALGPNALCVSQALYAARKPSTHSLTFGSPAPTRRCDLSHSISYQWRRGSLP